jgi:hypothetical protein
MPGPDRPAGWTYNTDPVSVELLASSGWTPPPADAFPTGRDVVTQYLTPLAQHPRIAPHLWLNTRVIGVSRVGVDRTKTADRERRPARSAPLDCLAAVEDLADLPRERVDRERLL